MAPETRYARSGDVHIAYQTVGAGASDLLLVPEFWHSIEAQWDQPALAAFLDRLSSYGRLISFDQRGTGVSDPVPPNAVLALEQWLDDITAVMDEAMSEQAVLLGFGGGGSLSMLFAATYPERTSGLVLVNSFPRLAEAPDYHWGRAPAVEDEVLHVMRTGWGRGVLLDLVAPSKVGDEEFRQWWARYQRLGSSPGTIVRMRRMLDELDVRDVLPNIRVSTLVLHRADNTFVRVEHGRYLADHIPGARYREVPGSDYFPFLGNADLFLDEIGQFLDGLSDAPDPDRVVTTVLFTDIVASTQRAAELGDRRWAELLGSHHAVIRRELERFRGHEVDTAGDGFFATFDGPARAVRCALAIVDAVRPLGLEIRAGVHTGEVEIADGERRGVAVHIGQRVLAQARGGEVLASSTVKDLVAGSGLVFADRGVHELKGVPERWRLFQVMA
ncbi:MAG: adenylate/guanylate cyclase domain-containing protein [Actinomycetota bacterium]|nr:adenylate/guanylate cyclase domain-containing protein [Actinomycetota bacterium]